MTKILLAEPLPPFIVEHLRAAMPPGVEFVFDPSPSEEDFARVAADADVLLSGLRPINARALELAPRVRFIQHLGVGYNNLDVDAIARAGIPTAYNPGTNASVVGEHTIMLMLVLLRRFVAADQLTRAGRFGFSSFTQENQARMGELSGACVGLVGFGNIGQAVATRLAAFGAQVLYTARHERDPNESRLGARCVPFQELLARSDIVSLHLPLSPETRNLIGDVELSTMHVGSFLVNTSRGGLVDEAALRRTLENGHLAGAALDVLEDESADVNPFADLPQVIVTPHAAGTSRESMPRAMRSAVANVDRFLRGEPVHNRVPGTTGTTGTHLEK